MKSELKRLWFKTKEKIKDWQSEDPIIIASYLSYANKHEVIIRGRVLENEGVVVSEEDGKWDNFLNSIKRMESDAIKNARVVVNYHGVKHQVWSDEEGYFKIVFPINENIQVSDDLQWDTALLSLPDFLDNKGEAIKTEVNILLRHPETEFAIITDVDDTLLQSHVNSFLKLRLLYETFLKNIHSRIAFENIGNVMEQLTLNKTGQKINPVFFLSHSPWNLYEVLEQFMEKNNIPQGPFFLRDFGYKRGNEKFEFEHHKALAIEHLMNFYPDLSFVLIGDATEHDVDIYTEAFKKFPGRVLNIFIRVTEKEEKNNHVRDVQTQNPDAPINLIQHSDEILEIV